MATIWYTSKIKKIENFAPNVRRVWLEKPAGFEFRAGQFITMDLPIGEKRLQRWRSYSIANAPADEDLEFCIVRSASGEGSKYLFEKIGMGAEIKFKGPDGAFFLPEKIETDLVFICTGTGVAPFRSMILDLKNRKIPTKNIHLIFGTRFENGILYRSDFENFQSQLGGFQYDAALSRQPDWPGAKGYVHEIYLKKYAVPRPDLHFYICGWSSMIDETVANLLVKLGYDRSQVHFELYG